MRLIDADDLISDLRHRCSNEVFYKQVKECLVDCAQQWMRYLLNTDDGNFMMMEAEHAICAELDNYIYGISITGKISVDTVAQI